MTTAEGRWGLKEKLFASTAMHLMLSSTPGPFPLSTPREAGVSVRQARWIGGFVKLKTFRGAGLPSSSGRTLCGT